MLRRVPFYGKGRGGGYTEDELTIEIGKNCRALLLCRGLGKGAGAVEGVRDFCVLFFWKGDRVVVVAGVMLVRRGQEAAAVGGGGGSRGEGGRVVVVTLVLRVGSAVTGGAVWWWHAINAYRATVSRDSLTQWL